MFLSDNAGESSDIDIHLASGTEVITSMVLEVAYPVRVHVHPPFATHVCENLSICWYIQKVLAVSYTIYI